MDSVVRLTALALAGGSAYLLMSGGHGTANPAPGADREAVTHLRQVTTQYHDPSVAVTAGYQATEDCVEDMGLHYIDPSAFGRPVDSHRPAALLYAPNGEGRVRLVGVEWLKVDADQDLSTSTDRPSIWGHAFDGPMPGHFPGMPVHYDLHAYVWDPNPAGPFATWNTHVDC